VLSSRLRRLRDLCKIAGTNCGFTLIELMLVVVIIGVLLGIGMPVFRNFLLRGNVTQAEAYLQQIGAQERIFNLRTGAYVVSSSNKEQDLEDQLGVDLKEAGDFCFVTVCRSTCVNEGGSSMTSSANYVASTETGDPAIEFEIWAILRRSTGVVTGPGGLSCTPVADKFSPSGWVQTDGVAVEGSVVVLRYPPPIDGPDNVSGIDGIHFDWRSGLSLSHAIVEH